MASQAGETTTSELDGWYKKRYGKYEKAVPINSVLKGLIPFSEADAEGEEYSEPIGLQLEHGVTYFVGADGAAPLDPPISAKTKNAKITGVQHLLRAGLSYDAAARAARSERAFGKATQQKYVDMRESILKRLELDLWYGQYGLGTVASVSSNTITITTAEFATGIWCGMEGALLEIFDTALTTQRTGTAKITAVDLELRTVTVDALPTGTTATDVIFFKTQRTTSEHKTMVGMHKILTNTGTLFNISASDFSLWKANSLAAGGANLSFGLVQKIVGRMVGKGLEGNVVALCNPMAWASLITDQAALRRYGAERARWDNGSESIRFYGQTGWMDMKPSFYCKEGYSYVISPEEWKRIGSSDMTFKMPGMEDGQGTFFRHMSDHAGVEWRCYSNQALYTPKPGRAGIITGIVNT